MQVPPDRDLGRYPGDRVSGCLRGQRRGAAHPGIHLNHVITVGFGVKGELDVAATFNPQRPDDAQRRRTQHLYLAV